MVLLLPLHASGAELTLAPGMPLTPAMVGELVRGALAARGLAGDLAVEIRQPRGETPNRAVAPMRISLVELEVDQGAGRFQGRIEAVLPSGERAQLPTSGVIDRAVDVLVPARAIARGQGITDGDLTTVRLPASSLPADALTRASEIVGRQAARNLAPQRAVRAGDVAEPWLVRRGDEAAAVFRRGSLEIVSAGEALDNGRQGETVRVRNLDSGEVRRAVVVAPRRVEVATP
ncbi:MAG: flagellar basal body P-ring formation chaperone FlgA [Geminicoccaceae bacterium]